MEPKKGLIFNIQRFSIHDGPGVRTTVFFKGCPLKCHWCSNPESLNPYPEFMLNDTKCILCKKCSEVCKNEAIIIEDNTRKIIRDKCNLCLQCTDVCPTGAITRVGEYKSVDEIIEEVIKDKPFYDTSAGGVTLSGGEPLYQPEFALELLKRLKKEGLHTALDTSGYCKWTIFKEILNYVDLLLYDIKHLDSKKHKQEIGVDNTLILTNLKEAAKMGIKIWIRLPLIPNYNTDEETIKKIMQLSKEIDAERLSLLPYHEWGKHKYEKLGMDYKLKNIKPLTEKEVEKLKDINTFGVNIHIGS